MANIYNRYELMEKIIDEKVEAIVGLEWVKEKDEVLYDMILDNKEVLELDIENKKYFVRYIFTDDRNVEYSIAESKTKTREVESFTSDPIDELDIDLLNELYKRRISK